MSLFPDDEPPPPAPAAKPRLTAQQRHAQRVDQLMSIRLRILIGTELDQRGITIPANIGAVLDMPPAEAMKLLTRRHRCDGDIVLLQAAATRLGLLLPDASIDWPTGHSHRSQ